MDDTPQLLTLVLHIQSPSLPAITTSTDFEPLAMTLQHTQVILDGHSHTALLILLVRGLELDSDLTLCDLVNEILSRFLDCFEDFHVVIVDFALEIASFAFVEGF
jgi:hypothetical protein